MVDDHGSTRIDLACPHCQQLFKVRLRKLQFGADLTCRLCRHEFSAHEVSSRPDIQDALARMQSIVRQRTEQAKPNQPGDVTLSSPAQQPKVLAHQGGERRPLIAQRRGGQGSFDV